MFTGLIADVGTLAAVETGGDGARLRVETALAGELAGGDSVSVCGACLTVAEPGPAGFTAEVMHVTLERTKLGSLAAGDRVNLEPALRASGRLGGHIVQGHVDGVGTVAAVAEDGFARRLGVELPAELQRYVVERGSIALDGVSLTVADLSDGEAVVSLIPETLERTTLGSLGPGDAVNIEVDVIARYVESMLSAREPQLDVTGS